MRRSELPIAAAIGLSLTLAGAGPGDSPADLAAQETRTGPTGATVEDLAWLAGHWVGEAFGGDAEEGWFGPAGGAMSGVFRLLIDGRPVVYELLLLEEQEYAVYYRFKHIGPGWMPREDERLEYRLVELGERHARFESTSEKPTPGAPRRFSYQRTEDDRLLVRGYDWEDRPFELDYRLQP